VQAVRKLSLEGASNAVGDIDEQGQVVVA